jgi:hypothetical protein
MVNRHVLEVFQPVDGQRRRNERMDMAYEKRLVRTSRHRLSLLDIHPISSNTAFHSHRTSTVNQDIFSMGRRKSQRPPPLKLTYSSAEEYLQHLKTLSDPKTLTVRDWQNPSARARSSFMIDAAKLTSKGTVDDSNLTQKGTAELKRQTALRKKVLGKFRKVVEDSIKTFGEYLQERPWELPPCWLSENSRRWEPEQVGRQLSDGATADKLSTEAARAAETLLERILGHMDDQELGPDARKIVLTIEPTLLPPLEANKECFTCDISLRCPSLTGKPVAGYFQPVSLDGLPSLVTDSERTVFTKQAKPNTEHEGARKRRKTRRFEEFTKRIKSARTQANYKLFTDIYTKAREGSKLTATEEFILKAVKQTMCDPYDKMVESFQTMTPKQLKAEKARFGEGLAEFDETITKAIERTEEENPELYQALFAPARVTEREGDRTESRAPESVAASLPIATGRRRGSQSDNPSTGSSPLTFEAASAERAPRARPEWDAKTILRLRELMSKAMGLGKNGPVDTRASVGTGNDTASPPLTHGFHSATSVPLSAQSLVSAAA